MLKIMLYDVEKVTQSTNINFNDDSTAVLLMLITYGCLSVYLLKYVILKIQSDRRIQINTRTHTGRYTYLANGTQNPYGDSKTLNDALNLEFLTRTGMALTIAQAPNTIGTFEHTYPEGLLHYDHTYMLCFIPCLVVY